MTQISTKYLFLIATLQNSSIYIYRVCPQSIFINEESYMNNEGSIEFADNRNISSLRFSFNFYIGNIHYSGRIVKSQKVNKQFKDSIAYESIRIENFKVCTLR